MFTLHRTGWATRKSDDDEPVPEVESCSVDIVEQADVTVPMERVVIQDMTDASEIVSESEVEIEDEPKTSPDSVTAQEAHQSIEGPKSVLPVSDSFENLSKGLSLNTTSLDSKNLHDKEIPAYSPQQPLRSPLGLKISTAPTDIDVYAANVFYARSPVIMAHLPSPINAVVA